MVKVRKCECCGRPVPDIDVMVELTKQQGKIMILLDNAGRAGLTKERLVDLVYADNPDGGPLHAITALYIARTKMQPILKKFGMRISTQRGGLWRLEVDA